MSVYTSITQAELEQFLLNYSLGELTGYQGISAGIENTNYFVITTQGRYVLTIFEILRAHELPYYIELMAFLNEHEVPSAHPIADLSNNYLQQLKNKPAILMQCLPGKSVLNPGVQHCEAIGVALAKLHITGLLFPAHQKDFRGEQWRMETGNRLLGMLQGDDAQILKDELQAQASADYGRLPQGVIHADLFRDNVLFEGDRLSGILDFYNACTGSFLYDLAITVNDWCVEQEGRLDFKRAFALCQAYVSERPVEKKERDQWPVMLRAAALRFWLSRLWSRHHPKPGELTFQKDPREFKEILLARRREVSALNEVWH